MSKQRESLAYVRHLDGIGPRQLELAEDIEGREQEAERATVAAMKRATELRDSAAAMRKSLAKTLAPLYTAEAIAAAKEQARAAEAAQQGAESADGAAVEA